MVHGSQNRGSWASWGPTIIFSEKKSPYLNNLSLDHNNCNIYIIYNIYNIKWQSPDISKVWCVKVIRKQKLEEISHHCCSSEGRGLHRSPQQERWRWEGSNSLKKKSYIWVCMKRELMVHLFPEDPTAGTLSSTLLEQPPPLAFRFQQQPLSRPRRLPRPFSEPGRGWFVVNQNSFSFQPVEEPPWLQSQPRHV